MTEERKEAHRKTVRNWAATHPNERKAINKRYRERHKDAVRRRLKDWRARMSPEQKKAYYKRAYAKYKVRLAANPEYAARRKIQVKATVRRYIETHKKERAARHKAYAATHRDTEGNGGKPT